MKTAGSKITSRHLSVSDKRRIVEKNGLALIRLRSL